MKVSCWFILYTISAIRRRLSDAASSLLRSSDRNFLFFIALFTSCDTVLRPILWYLATSFYNSFKVSTLNTISTFSLTFKDRPFLDFFLLPSGTTSLKHSYGSYSVFLIEPGCRRRRSSITFLAFSRLTSLFSSCRIPSFSILLRMPALNLVTIFSSSNNSPSFKVNYSRVISLFSCTNVFG